MSRPSSSAQTTQVAPHRNPAIDLFRSGRSDSPSPTAFAKLPPEVIVKIFLHVEIRDILSIRQTCRHLLAQTKLHKVWIGIASKLRKEKGLVWPSWALPLTAIPASTLEDLVVRASRLSWMVNEHETETRKGFEGVIQRPWDSPVWLHLVRGRWLLLQLSDYTLELWDLDLTEYTYPVATYAGLEGFVNGVLLAERTNGVEITLSTTLFHAYKFAPDLPFRQEVRAVSPALTLIDSFHGYSSVKTRQGRLLAFAESAGDPLRACILDESTRYSVELAFGIHVFECQRTLDICTRDEVFFVARHRNLELYMSSDVKRALETGGTTACAISPFQTFSYPGDILHSPQFHITTPVYFDAPEGSVTMAHFFEDEWQAIVVSPQRPSSSPQHRDYKIEDVAAIGSGVGTIYGIRTGENGYRCTVLCDHRLTLHYGKPWDTIQCVPENGEGFPERGRDRTHTLVSWEMPDFGVDLPRPECVAIDEAVGICVAAMGSGRIWIGDAVPRVKPKPFDVVPLLGRTPHPDPLWPLLPPSYFWDTFYPGPLSESDPVGEVAPGWSTAVDHYWPWRNNPKAYGGILWFVEHFMGIPGPARSCLFSTKTLFNTPGVLPSLEEFVDVNGRIFRITTSVEWVDAYRLIDGTTIEDVIDCLKGNRPSRGTRYDQDWMSDYMPVYQHMNWYRIFRHLKS
ncbi:hypothetical protein M407DRAFT_16630 [Tulasnella calospora MUT 4182]|uniref:F-box domain-containing protein n=1 Tax=Tulasnella calospora MUT 4182 TaxID=1051891 RepID=A0A0C3MLT8_9AGAM|nr:hypothetical protein M407DRAFT_16630 [Tulasnella calospora MUT 4182]